MEILEIAKEFFTKSVIEKIADKIGEDVPVVQTAMNAILPSVLGGIMEKGSTANGIEQLISIFNKNDEESMLKTFSKGAGETKQLDNLIYSGFTMLQSIFGKKIEKVEDVVSEESGISKMGASVLLNIAAPVLMSLIGKQFKTSGMGNSGLVNLLMSQKDAVKASLPAGLLTFSNFSGLGDYRGAGTSSGKHVQQVDYNEKSDQSGMPGWLPWLAGALLLIAGIWMFKTCEDKKKSTLATTHVEMDSLAGGISEIADSVASKVGTGIDALGDFFKRKLPNGIELDIPELGVENKLIKFIEDPSTPVDVTTWFNFDRINFETGSAKLSSESMEQTANIAEILKAFPNVSVKIGGYTDNTGDDLINQKLSQSRAEQVKDAIVSQGVKAERVEAEGYGKEHPVATNDTEEGRAQNRRIAIRVVKK
ncbi:OmpA family protein [Dyadobacter aurulentus]|uniref:OmpA family protein n=1 Tax=Dyadobacter sp. UC 10 TaxID=2605428 RepID=UPI0011F1354A|nr:OmpA family protein [Dyadobacter sp. UC 10]KAA0990058.1 OmpA family protein [Dyadobacter sp. UC 10]